MQRKGIKEFLEEISTYLSRFGTNVWLFHNVGLESYPQHELAKKQMTGFGGMVTFFIKGDLENAKQFFKSSKVYFCYLLLLVEGSNSQRLGSATEIDATKRSCSRCCA